MISAMRCGSGTNSNTVKQTEAAHKNQNTCFPDHVSQQRSLLIRLAAGSKLIADRNKTLRPCAVLQVHETVHRIARLFPVFPAPSHFRHMVVTRTRPVERQKNQRLPICLASFRPTEGSLINLISQALAAVSLRSRTDHHWNFRETRG